MSEKPGLPQTKIAPLYEYEELIKDQPKTYDWPDFSEDTHAVLYYTTGTTGLPKGGFIQTVRSICSSYTSIASAGIGCDASHRSTTAQPIYTHDECTAVSYPRMGGTFLLCLHGRQDSISGEIHAGELL